MNENVITWTFENWITVGLMALGMFFIFHMLTARMREEG